MVTLVAPAGSMPSVLPAVAGVLIRTPQAVKPLAFWNTTWKLGPFSRSMSYSVKLLAEATMSRGLFCEPPLALASAASCHQLSLCPYRVRSPRPSTRPWLPLLARMPSTPALAPLTVMNGVQPPLELATVPQVGLPESWYREARSEANSVTPDATTSVSPPPTVSGAARKAVLLPLPASSTALPLP